MLALLPVFLADAILAALAKLGLSPQSSLVLTLAIFLGGTVNVPVRRIPRVEVTEWGPSGLFGFGPLVPRRVRRTYSVIAVNVGGCVVPVGIAAYELARIAAGGALPLAAALFSIAINTVVCYRVARPVPNLGIAMPPLVPAALAAACGLLLARELAPLVAFAAGVLGPLLGADLMHLRHVRRFAAGDASIGGAGTFDGIVLSGLIATLLA
jgi:uncharacterized membrane protein